jgi:hypothetical protein
MAVAEMVIIFIVVDVVIDHGSEIMIGVPGVVMVVLMGMHARRNHIIAHMTMHASHHRPGGLEWHDDHQEQDKGSTHKGILRP